MEASKSPLLFYPGLDPQAYDVWAQKIAAGDWLGDKPFYQSPLYPYLLGGFYAIFGRHLVWIYIVQILIGCFDCLVIYGIASRVFGKRAGLLAGFFAAVYKPFIFYQSELLKTFLEVFFIDLSILLLLAASEKRSRSMGFLAGLALGLATLARDNFLLLIFWFFPWLLARLAKKGRPLASVYLLAGFAVIIGASALRNMAVGHDFVITTSQGGQNFYIGNHRKNLTGTYVAPDFVRANPFYEENDFNREALRLNHADSMRPGKVSSFWFKQALKEIRGDRKLFLQRMALKLALFWNQKEIADQESIYLFKKEFSILMRMPLLGFGVVGPFGLLGLVMALRRRKGVLLAGYVFYYWVSVSLFFIFARYRLAVVGPLLAFAAFGVEDIYIQVRQKRWKNLAGWSALLAACFGLAWMPLIHDHLDYAYYNLGNSYARAEKYQQAIASYEKAIQENPREADFWINLGKAHEHVGDNPKALEAYGRAVELAPGKASAHMDLGIAFYKVHSFEDAKTELEKALALDPNLGEAGMYLTMTKARLKDISPVKP